MTYEPDKYPHSEITDKIISVSYYVANGYKIHNVAVSSDELHDKFRDDICNLLNERGFHAITEQHFPKPLKEALVKGFKVRHFADLMVQSFVLVEIKAGQDKYLFDKESVNRFIGQTLNTLEYSGLRLMLLLRITNDGEFKVTLKRFVL